MQLPEIRHTGGAPVALRARFAISFGF